LAHADKRAYRLIKDKLAQRGVADKAEHVLEDLLAQGRALLQSPQLMASHATGFDRDVAAAESLSTLAEDALAPLKALQTDLAERIKAQAALQRQARDWEARVKAWVGAMSGLWLAADRDVQAKAWQARAGALAHEAEAMNTHAEWVAMPSNVLRAHDEMAKEMRAALSYAGQELERLAQLPPTSIAAPVTPVAPAASATAAEAEPGLAQDAAPQAAVQVHQVQELATVDVGKLLVLLNELENTLNSGATREATQVARKLADMHAHSQAWPNAHRVRWRELESRVLSLQGWQRWRADQLREELCIRAEQLHAEPLAPRKQQDALRRLRDEWKQLDHTGAPANNGALWQRFDTACNAAYAPVAEFVAQEKAAQDRVEQERTALIEELRAFASVQDLSTADGAAWRKYAGELDRLGHRWREGGHLPEKRYAALQAQWKEAMDTAAAPLKEAQRNARQRRDALIAQAIEAAQATQGDVAARLKQLQLQWQEEARAMPLPRVIEQKLWERFRAPQDAWHNARKQAHEEQRQQRDAQANALRDAINALEKAAHEGDAAAVNAAWQAVEQQWDAQFPRAQAAPADARGRGQDRRGPQSTPPHPQQQRVFVPQGLINARRHAEEQARKRLHHLRQEQRGSVLDAWVAAWQSREASALQAEGFGKAVNKAAAQRWLQAVSAGKGSDAARDDALIKLELAAGCDSPPEAQAARRVMQLQVLANRGRDELHSNWPQAVEQVMAGPYTDAAAERFKRCMLKLLRD
jgi:hypothetical protein